MQFTRDMYTGKRFYYEIMVELDGKVTVGRWSNKEQRLIYLHPARLPKELYNSLNAGEANIRDDDNVIICDICLSWVATHQEKKDNETYFICDKLRCQDRVGE